ncbi:MAG: T9SS type A sorting domain-containing protein, partial [Reichenbachiella sp.]
TNSSGIATFTSVLPVSNATYTISKIGYEDISGSLSVTDADISRTVSMNADATLTAIGNELNVISKVYPNPSTGLVTIKLTQSFMSSSLMIHNTSGQLVMRKRLDQSESIIDLSKQNPGVYIMRVTVDGQQYIGRIVLIK